MGPPTGGRNHITPRLMRHFNLMCFCEFDNNTLERIFTTIVNWYYTSNNFSSEVQKMAGPLVTATLETYRGAMAR